MIVERPHFTYIVATPNQVINREAAAEVERERELRSIIRPIIAGRLINKLPTPIVKLPRHLPIPIPQPIIRPLPPYEGHGVSHEPLPRRPLPIPVTEPRLANIPRPPPPRPIIEPISVLHGGVLFGSSLSELKSYKELQPPHPTPTELPPPDIYAPRNLAEELISMINKEIGLSAETPPPSFTYTTATPNQVVNREVVGGVVPYVNEVPRLEDITGLSQVVIE